MVPHVGGEEHGGKRKSLLRGSECAAGFSAGGGTNSRKIKTVRT